MSYGCQPTQPGDAAQIDIHEWDVPGLHAQSWFDDQLSNLSHCFTLSADGRPYAIVGGYYTATGVVDLMMFSDRGIGQHSRHFLTTCRALLEQAHDEGVHRWQVFIPVSNLVSSRLVEHLGFTVEARLTSYYPDGDAYLFAKVRQPHG